MRFANRTQAGEALASQIVGKQVPVHMVFGLARGGVIVADPIAKTLKVPLDVLVVKKIPSPYNAELAVGAVAADGVSLIHWRDAHRVGADEAYIRQQTDRLGDVIKQKTILYRKGKKPVSLAGKDIVIVDDGAATGSTLETAVLWLKAKKAKRITIAIPVAPTDVVTKITPEVFSLIVLHTPNDMGSVGEFYESFPQVDEHKVVELLA